MTEHPIRYADIHFHTEHSDNRDRASLAQMVEQGRRCGISYLSSADHNHNVTTEKWRALTRDRDALEDESVSCGCEGTFKRGHFLILEPNSVSGDFEESVRRLYGEGDHPIILAHPIPGMDEWHEVLYPSVTGIEVVNGAVLAYGIHRGDSISSICDLPTMTAFFAYLDIGMAPAVTGSSDAHRIDALGTGVTGFWGAGSFSDALRGRRTFASTDNDIELQWQLEGDELQWSCADRRAANGTLVLYRGRDVVTELVCKAEEAATARLDYSGAIRLEEPGFYWLGYLAGNRFGVGSPIRHDAEISVNHSARRTSVSRSLTRQAERLAAFAATHATPWDRLDVDSGDLSIPKEHAENRATVQVYGVEPELYATGRPIGGERTLIEPSREVVGLSGGSEYRDELLVYLSRNEIHEYRIVSLTVDAIAADRLSLSAWLAPSEHVRRDNWRHRWVSTAEKIAETVADEADVTATFLLLPCWEFEVSPSANASEPAVRDGTVSSAIRSCSAVAPAALRPWIYEAHVSALFSSRKYRVQVF